MAKKINNKKETRTSNIPVKKGNNNKKNATKDQTSNVLTYKEGMTVLEIAEGMSKPVAQVI